MKGLSRALLPALGVLATAATISDVIVTSGRQHRLLVRPASDVALRVRRRHLWAGAGREVQPARRAGARAGLKKRPVIRLGGGPMAVAGGRGAASTPRDFLNPCTPQRRPLATAGQLFVRRQSSTAPMGVDTSS